MINFNTIKYGYQNPETASQKYFNFLEGYFHIKDYVALDLDSGTQFQCKASSWGVTALKIASYITCIIPLIMRIALLIYRETGSIIPHLEENPFEAMGNMAITTEKTRKAIFVIGAVGSGKRSLIERRIKLGGYEDYQIVGRGQENIAGDQEAIRKGDSDTKTKLQAQGRDLRNQKYAKCVEERVNFIDLDTGAALHFYRENIRQLRGAGYFVKMILVTLNEKELEARCIEIRVKTGRQIPVELMKSTAKASLQTFNECKELADEWERYDNTDLMQLVERKE